MLKLLSDKFVFHANGCLTYRVIRGEIALTIGTPKTRIKENREGFNHSDLAKGAIANFFCWGSQQVFLRDGDSYVLGPFVAYRVDHIYGEYKMEGKIDGQIEFSLP